MIKSTSPRRASITAGILRLAARRILESSNFDEAGTIYLDARKRNRRAERDFLAAGYSDVPAVIWTAWTDVMDAMEVARQRDPKAPAVALVSLVAGQPPR